MQEAQWWEKWILSILLPVFFLMSLQGKLLYCLISAFSPSHMHFWAFFFNSWKKKYHPTNLYLKRNRNHVKFASVQTFHLCVCVCACVCVWSRPFIFLYGVVVFSWSVLVPSLVGLCLGSNLSGLLWFWTFDLDHKWIFLLVTQIKV